VALANSHAPEKRKFRVPRSNSPGFEWRIELPERHDLTWQNPPRKMLRREFARVMEPDGVLSAGRMLARNWHDDAISPELGSFCQKSHLIAGLIDLS
jgi:hypothetical protein